MIHSDEKSVECSECGEEMEYVRSYKERVQPSRDMTDGQMAEAMAGNITTHIEVWKCSECGHRTEVIAG